MERHFHNAIGLSPKQLGQTIRLQNALKMIMNGKYSNLTTLAFDSNFYDQTHLIKDFKELIVSILCSWKIIYSTEINNANWVIGTWQMKTPNGDGYESWKKINRYELLGKSYTLKNKNTVAFETVQLVQKADSIFYIPTVKRHNPGLPVHFAMKLVFIRPFRS